MCDALNASAAELAVLSRDINHLTQLLRQGSVEAARSPTRRAMRRWTRDVREHLALGRAPSSPSSRPPLAAHAVIGQQPREPTMSSDPSIDGVLVQWGDRLFYPRQPDRQGADAAPGPGFSSRATAIRSRIEATVRRAPQVMVKVTGGGRGMAAIAAHFRYISKNGRLEIEDDRGVVERGKEALHDIERQWRLRRRLHRRRGPSARSLQRHAVDAAGHRSR